MAPVTLQLFLVFFLLQCEDYRKENVYLYFAVFHNSRHATSLPLETMATVANTERLRAGQLQFTIPLLVNVYI